MPQAFQRTMMRCSNEYMVCDQPTSTAHNTAVSNSNTQVKNQMYNRYELKSICISYWTSDAITMIMAFSIDKLAYFKLRAIFNVSTLWFVKKNFISSLTDESILIFFILQNSQQTFFFSSASSSFVVRMRHILLWRMVIPQGYCKFDHELFFFVVVVVALAMLVSDAFHPYFLMLFLSTNRINAGKVLL